VREEEEVRECEKEVEENEKKKKAAANEESLFSPLVCSSPGMLFKLTDRGDGRDDLSV
jgi:hypothetical protein